MSAVESFLKDFEERLRHIEELERVLDDILECVEKLQNLYLQVGRLNILTRLRKIEALSAEELLNLRRTNEVESLVKEVGREAVMEAISKIIGCDVRNHVRARDFEELYALYKEVVDMLDKFKHIEEIKYLICYNLMNYDEKLDDISHHRKQLLLKLDVALSEVKDVRIQFIEGDLFSLVWNSIKEKRISELERLPKLIQVLKIVSGIEPLPKVSCEDYYSLVVRRWCNTYNKLIERFLRLLKELTDLLHKLDISMVNELYDLYDRINKVRDEIEKYRKSVKDRASRVIKRFPLVEDFNALLKFVDEHIRRQQLTSTQQHILEVLSDKGEISLTKLAEELQERGLKVGFEELLRELYDLCLRGIVDCMVRL